MNNGDKPLTLDDLVAEASRAQVSWFRQYMDMGRFSTCYMREANTLMDAAEHAVQVLRTTDRDELSVIELEELLDKAIKAAQKIRLNSVQPQPAPVETRRAFVWMAEQEGLSVITKDGGFASAHTQALWLAFQKGAIYAEKRMDQPAVIEQPKKKRWLA